MLMNVNIANLADNPYLRALAVLTTVVAGSLAIYHMTYQVKLTKLNLIDAERRLMIK